MAEIIDLKNDSKVKEAMESLASDQAIDGILEVYNSDKKGIVYNGERTDTENINLIIAFCEHNKHKKYVWFMDTDVTVADNVIYLDESDVIFSEGDLLGRRAFDKDGLYDFSSIEVDHLYNSDILTEIDDEGFEWNYLPNWFSKEDLKENGFSAMSTKHTNAVCIECETPLDIIENGLEFNESMEFVFIREYFDLYNTTFTPFIRLKDTTK